MLLMFIVQSCTCWGIPLDKYYLSLGSSNQSQPQPVQNNVVQPAGMNCDNLRLTSPLDGLPNGDVTFYWDTLPGATSYRINVFGEGAFLAGYDATGDQTNLTTNVSQGTIGGQFILTVELIAADANGNTCSKSYVLQREAPRDTGGSDPEPEPTPTCEENPYASYC